MSYSSSWRLPASVGVLLTALAIGGGASGLLSNGIGGCVVLPGLMLMLDAHAGTQTLDYLSGFQYNDRREAAERIYFSQPSAWRRYLSAVSSAPLLLAFLP